MLRKYVDTLAIGSQANAQQQEPVEVEVADATGLLRAMIDSPYATLTMAQICGVGYENISYGRRSSWQSFNIVVGDSNLDRIAFWNSRLGLDEYKRKQITALRVREAQLEDTQFMEALVLFISRCCQFDNGRAFAVVRSSSIIAERLQPLADALGPRNVQASVEVFHDANAPTPQGVKRPGSIRLGYGQRFTESRIPLVPVEPRHLKWGSPITSWLAQGAWVSHVRVEREGERGFSSSLQLYAIPRRWQAVRTIAEGNTAKSTFGGELRIVTKLDSPKTLSFIDDDATFVGPTIGAVPLPYNDGRSRAKVTEAGSSASADL